MPTLATQEVTALLVAWRNGDQAALERLTPLVYVELHQLAHRYMRRENPGHTLQTSALVNEAFVRLIEQPQVNWQNRAHFFGIAAQMMRHILLDHARSQARTKRGGAPQVSLDETALVTGARGGIDCAGRRAQRVGDTRCPQKPSVGVAFFRRPEQRGSGRSAAPVAALGRTRMAQSQSLAIACAQQG